MKQEARESDMVGEQEQIIQKQKIAEKYIFDSEKIWRREDFSQIKLNKHTFAYCLFIPHNTTKEYKAGGGSYTLQKFAPVIIDSNLAIHPFSYEFRSNYCLDFQEVPYDSNVVCWPLERIKEDIIDSDLNTHIVNNNSLDVPVQETIFNRIKKEYEKYCAYNSPDWYIINPLWDMATYFFKLFYVFPIKENRGLKGTGKTKSMKLSRMISYNGISEKLMINPTISVMFRGFGESKGTRYVDEAESIFRFERGKIQADDRVEIVNASYEKAGVITRLEKVGNKFERRRYSAYCPLQIGSIMGLYGATADRSITQHHLKNGQNDSRGELEIDEHDYIFSNLRADLFLLGLMYWENIEEIYNTLESNGLKSRDFAIWKPLLTVARFISEELYEKVLNIAKKDSRTKKIDETENSYELQLVKIAYDCLNEKSWVFISDIREAWTPDPKPHAKTISRHLDDVGFRPFKDHSRNGNGYQFESKNHFLNIVSLNFPSFASQKQIEIEEKPREEKIEM